MIARYRELQCLIARALFFGICWQLRATDTITTNQLGQGVVYRHYHYDSLYNAKQEVYVMDVNLNDPAPSFAFPFRTNGATRTVSAHAATVSNAVACVNGQFFSPTGSLQYLRVKGITITTTGSAVHDEQALTVDGAGRTNSVKVMLRPTGGWASVGTTISNIMASGPDLIRNGVQFTNYDYTDSLVIQRNPRTTASLTYDNHLLITCCDGRSTAAAGMTLLEMSAYLLSQEAVQNAVNFDGGGSTTVWIKGTVVNVPSDGQQNGVADAIAIVAPPPGIPAVPVGLSAKGAIAQVALTWSVSSGAMLYHVNRATAQTGPFTNVTTVTNAFFTDTGLNYGTTYYYSVNAANSVGTSSNSAVVSATTTCTTPPAPVGFTAQTTNSHPLLTWQAVPGATSYHVNRATTSGGAISLVAVVTTTNYLDTNAVLGASYFYYLNTVNPCNLSAPSVEISAPLVIASSITATNLISGGYGGVAGQSYYVLASTNLSLPISNWTRIATNQFGARGSFQFTNSIDPAAPGRFLLIQGSN